MKLKMLARFYAMLVGTHCHASFISIQYLVPFVPCDRNKKDPLIPTTTK